MTNALTPDVYIDRTVVDANGDKIGSIGQVYVNDETNVPDWVTVNTGLFGLKENFVPLEGSRLDGENIVVPFGKDVVKDSPKIEDASHLDADEQQELYAYYQQHTSGTTDPTAGSATASASAVTPDAAGSATADFAGDVPHADTDRTRSTEGHDTSGPTTDSAMTRSEERLSVGTERVEAGRARLRKYVVTEQQTVSVPVSHEEVRVDREPITESNRGDALDGPALSEEEHEVVLHAERPVVTTEAVPVERVRLGTETVTDTESVTGKVRKEEIELVDESSSGTAVDSDRTNR